MSFRVILFQVPRAAIVSWWQSLFTENNPDGQRLVGKGQMINVSSKAKCQQPTFLKKLLLTNCNNTALHLSLCWKPALSKHLNRIISEHFSSWISHCVQQCYRRLNVPHYNNSLALIHELMGKTETQYSDNSFKELCFRCGPLCFPHSFEICFPQTFPVNCKMEIVVLLDFFLEDLPHTTMLTTVWIWCLYSLPLCVWCRGLAVL